MLTRRLIIAAASAAPLLIDRALAGDDKTAKAAPVPHSIDDLLKPPVMLDVALSPDGTRLAFLVERRLGDNKRDLQLVYRRTVETKAPKGPVSLGDYAGEKIVWASNDRLLVWLRREFEMRYSKGRTNAFGSYVEKSYTQHVMAIGENGADPVLLLSPGNGGTVWLGDRGKVADMMIDDPRHILMQPGNSLVKVDILTGATEEFERGTSDTVGWVTQRGMPIIRYDTNNTGSKLAVMTRPPGAKAWKHYRTIRRDERYEAPELRFIAPTAEPGMLLVLDNDQAADLPAIRLFDTRTMTMGEVFAQHNKRPITGLFMDEENRPISISVSDDRAKDWFVDPDLAGHYERVVATFDKTESVSPYEVSRDRKWLVFAVSGPRNPGSFWLYDVTRGSLKFLADRQPWLKAERLAPMEALRVETRDGATITAYLTTPVVPSDKPRPLVVLPHGGPEVRDTLAFDIFVQAFAAQGWMVLQPNFRGSSGYGRAFADKGRRHWGDLMQADVEDCVAKVLASGAADPNKVAIYGMSYGGYAALMGAVRKPDLYKAVVSVAGDAELSKTLSFARQQEGYDSDAYAYWIRTIGDPKTDKAMLAEASPALRAGEIKAPVLLIHGVDDTIVGVEQSRIMAKALKAAGKPCEVIEMKGVGHRDWGDENLKMVLEKSIAHIGKAFA